MLKNWARFLMDGSLYRGAKPVMWSPVEKTALAEAEIEYEDHTGYDLCAVSSDKGGSSSS